MYSNYHLHYNSYCCIIIQYPDKISENRLYDCGVELSRDGMYGRPDYLPHATRGTLSLDSLYFILWTNFTAFYMALATQPDALEKIRGPIISPRQDVHHYCVGQLRNAWLHMGNKLSLSPKEQSFFIMQCMERLLEVHACTYNFSLRYVATYKSYTLFYRLASPNQPCYKQEDLKLL